ncbi:MAG: SDR family NAD(P)-dependent oxidoreductase [bacterium]|nr:SDR family NAD(P)-dependent oxidoreductase [bacterium]
MEMFDLSGRVAAVTGGNRGIGLGMARGLAKAGAAVAVWGRSDHYNQAAVDQLQSLGAEALAVSCDVSSEQQVENALGATLERFGRIDALFANAGIGRSATFPELSTRSWERMMSVNATGTMLPVRAATAQMIEQGEGGSIVVTSSVAAHFGIPYLPHYAASKAAQLGLVKTLAVSLAPHRIRVNAVSPGWVATEMTGLQQQHDEFNRYIKNRVPLGRWGTIEEFEGIAVYLASDASAFTTGAEIRIDGGFSVY